MATQISHDAFARESILRETVSVRSGRTCEWCGGIRKNQTLFQYFIEPDSYGSSRNEIKGLFCSIGCMRTYHG